MPSPFGVGCAYVCMGTWSSLQGISAIRVSFILVRRLPSDGNETFCLTKSMYYEKDFLFDVAMCNYGILVFLREE